MTEQFSLFADNPEYDVFVDKFKPKKTTDDCYTPPIVYDAVAEWVAAEYGLDRSKFVRPFYPGGDYQAYQYAPDAVVVDNPPFSIFRQIIRWYQEHNVRFFLFGPALTLFPGKGKDTQGVTYIPVGADVIYENGANVRTSFVTNLDGWKVRTAPSLYQSIKTANDINQRAQKKELPKYSYPDYIITAAMVQRWSRYGIDYKLSEADCVNISGLESQKAAGKSVFGGGFLLSERAAAERAAAERAAAERAAAERAVAHKWELSERERKIVKRLSQTEGRTNEQGTSA